MRDLATLMPDNDGYELTKVERKSWFLKDKILFHSHHHRFLLQLLRTKNRRMMQ